MMSEWIENSPFSNCNEKDNPLKCVSWLESANHGIFTLKEDFFQ